MDTDRVRALLRNLCERVATLEEIYAGNALVKAMLPLIAQTSAVGLATIDEWEDTVKQVEAGAINALTAIEKLEQAAGITRAQ